MNRCQVTIRNLSCVVVNSTIHTYTFLSLQCFNIKHSLTGMLIKHTLTTQSPTHSHSHFTHTHYALSHIHSLHMHTHTHIHFICTHYSRNHFTHSLHTSIGNVLSITHHTRTHCRLMHYTHTLTMHSLTLSVCVCCV